MRIDGAAWSALENNLTEIGLTEVEIPGVISQQFSYTLRLNMTFLLVTDGDKVRYH